MDKDIGHYTTLDTVNFLIKDEQRIHDSHDSEKDNYPYMRLTNINQLNDPLEGKVLSQYLGINSTHISHSYVSCATTAEDSLPMWNLYSDNAEGIFMVYDKKFLESTIDDDYIDFYHVCYVDENSGSFIVSSIKNSEKICGNIKGELDKIKKSYEKIQKNKDNEKIKKQAEQLIENIFFLFKKIEYSYEEELRFYISARVDRIELVEEKGALFPRLYTKYKKTKLKYSKLILGPKEKIKLDDISPYIDYINDRNRYKKRIDVQMSKRHFR